MLALYGLIASVCLFSLVYTLWGTVYSVWRYRLAPPPRIWLPGLPGVSILKAVKGLDEGLLDNLESFATLDYPDYEVIISVAAEDDPAVNQLREFVERHPSGPFRLDISETLIGPNPKINNLAGAEKMATHDVILISDASVRARKSYLQEAVPLLRDERNGIVTATYQSFGADGLGAELEQLHLNTFYARSMNVANSAGQTFVMGASMLYRKSVAEKFGGLVSCTNYINEDYAMGLLMKFIGRRVAIMKKPVALYSGRRTFKAFWERHVRWSIIMKKAGTLVYLIQPLQFAFFVAALGALSLPAFYQMSPATAAAGILASWFVMDSAIIWAISGKAPKLHIWLLREALSPVIWLNALLTSHVNWRGHPLTIESGGYINPPK